MVRFCDLRLFRSPDWSPLLPASRSGRPAAFGIRCICDRLSDAAYRRRVGRPYRRQVAAGWLSDRVGRKPLMLFASMGGVIGALPLFWLLNHPSELLAQLGQLGLVVLMGLYYGALPATLVEAAPPTVRCTTVALGYNLCLGLFGGLSPLVATWLVERTGDEIAPAFLIMAAATVTFVTLFNFQETYRAPFGVAPRTTAAK